MSNNLVLTLLIECNEAQDEGKEVRIRALNVAAITVIDVIGPNVNYAMALLTDKLILMYDMDRALIA